MSKAQAPLWKKAFDKVEQFVATHAENAIATDRFADSAAAAIGTAAPVARLVPGVPTPDPSKAIEWVGGQLDRALHRTRNGLKVLTGYDAPQLAQSPKDVVWERDRARLFRYQSSQRRHATPLLLTMSLVSTSKVVDLRPEASFVSYLLQTGFDVFLLDWGVADERDAQNRLDTYIDNYIDSSVDAITKVTGSDQVDITGYCFGGVLALLYTASYPERVRRLAVMATPVDWTHMGPLMAMTKEGRLKPEDLFDTTGNVPADTMKRGFMMLKPTAQMASYATLLQHLDNDAFVHHYRAVNAWGDEHVPFPGACFADMTRILAHDNALVKGTTIVGDRVVRLADITCPVLCIVCVKDHICPPPAAEPLIDLVSSEHKQLTHIPAGHIGLLIGGAAVKVTLPALVGWFTDDLAAADDQRTRAKPTAKPAAKSATRKRAVPKQVAPSR